MTRSDDLFGDMPTLPSTFDKRDDDILAALVSGTPLPSDAPVEARLVADLFTALAGPPSAGETAGLEAARLAFRAEHPGAYRPAGYGAAPHRVARPGARRRPSPSRGGGRLVAASILGLLGLGGVTGAAFAGVLPDALQTVAHRLLGVPAPGSTGHGANHSSGHRPSGSTAPGGGSTHTTGPDATGPTAYGLCTAYDRSRTGTAGPRAAYAHSRGYSALVAAAGGEAQVATYCAAVLHPSAGAPGATHPAGKPSAPGSSPGNPAGGRRTETGRPSDAPTHPVHPSHPGSSASSSAGLSSDPASSSAPAAPGNRSHTKVPPGSSHTPQGRTVTRSPH
ncbi:MAG TPA: hypothetical protein VGN18_14080 [Jatrophihabitans sp.]|jgi:hypothetical protein|uniref:hypothetical protein n=1 Tax=Jatrophihabitans sp. TaxID=1932789 RepID=UPI002DFCE1F1|nr:hypothetical protein [Jatrophihabitans sp.]